ncbi:AfsR/SARP family transcriptional regulator [Streptomyces clavuligerus]|uniref:Regulatory protein n=1 Tax=Streptomyces clavuligerus TaxID=1901 RepID=E2QAB3_STRCL|nr:AfsR/SARP family transcriptional regulator [Streptomyces clavuligerus]ANW21807.1 hypothetical protein BB341_05205 [Streptomyces clavuligerus]EFG09812.1 regulatory protein [Streptomyces clavuligerus]WDN54480.1 AfsR/SARP family transcriptional regulator [Streptomyces clavuligerus]
MIAESVSPIQFRLLGPVTASRAQSEVPLSGTKIQTVLAKLLLAGGRTVSDTSLSTALWGHHPPSTSSAQIYTYVSRLRKQLGAAVSIARQGPGYVLDAPHSEVDVFEFERLTALGQRALGQCDYTAASRYFGEGIELWQGEPLENATEHLQEVEVPRLLAARLTALEHRVEADLALGRHHQISAELTGLVAGFPLNERLRAQLITALYRCGRQAEAVHVYHKGRTVLAEQMGVDPGPELRAAYESMLRGEMHGTAAAPAVVPTTLPPVPVPFVGRSRALDLLGAILVPRRAHRAEQPVRALITGIAGIGKSGLAAVAAHGAAHHYPDGQLHAELCHADGRPKTPGEVLVRLLRALGEPRASADHSGFPALTGDVEELVRLYRTRTAGRRLLLLLDDATGDAQIDPLLPAGTGTAVVVTSRTHLTSVPMAHTVVLDPMGEEEALQLLGATMGAQRMADQPEVARTLVRQCAGLPLAVRIAGTRLASRPQWPLSELAGRLADPSRRLEELRFGDLGVSDGFRSSFGRLRPRTRKTLPWLSMLGEQPFTAAAAGGALGMSAHRAESVLEDLVDASLMGITRTAQAQLTYQFHPLVLLFAEALSHDGRPMRPCHA